MRKKTAFLVGAARGMRNCMVDTGIRRCGPEKLRHLQGLFELTWGGRVLICPN